MFRASTGLSQSLVINEGDWAVDGREGEVKGDISSDMKPNIACVD